MRVVFIVSCVVIFMAQGNSALFCHDCMPGVNFTCTPGQKPPQTKVVACAPVSDNEKRLGASPACYTAILPQGEKLRGCSILGGTVTSQQFCKYLTKSDNQNDCLFCKTDECNKAESIDIFVPLLILAVVINRVVLNLYGH